MQQFKAFELEKNKRRMHSHLTNLYQRIYKLLQEEKQKAQALNKPLLILIGEAHDDCYSVLAEVAILSAAINLDFKRFCDEIDQSRYDVVMNTESFQRHLHQFLEDLSLKFEFIDKGVNNQPELVNYPGIELPQKVSSHMKKGKAIIQNYHPTDKEGIQYRNKIMATELNKQPHEDVAAIVGLGHLFGLYNEVDLSAFHVISFNTHPRPIITNTAYEKNTIQFAFSKAINLRTGKNWDDELISLSEFRGILEHFSKLCQSKDAIMKPKNEAGEVSHRYDLRSKKRY